MYGCGKGCYLVHITTQNMIQHPASLLRLTSWCWSIFLTVNDTWGEVQGLNGPLFCTIRCRPGPTSWIEYHALSPTRRTLCSVEHLFWHIFNMERMHAELWIWILPLDQSSVCHVWSCCLIFVVVLWCDMLGDLHWMQDSLSWSGSSLSSQFSWEWKQTKQT